jgi:hypothetical protein
MKLERLLKENMRRFNTKNLNEQDMNNSEKFYGFYNLSEFQGQPIFNFTANSKQEVVDILNQTYRDITKQNREVYTLDDMDRSQRYPNGDYINDDYALVTDNAERFQKEKEGGNSQDSKFGNMLSKKINWRSLEFEDVDLRDYPDFSDAYVSYAEYEDGTALTDDELELLDLHEDDRVYDALMNKYR